MKNDSAIARIGPRSQMVIPKKVRERLGVAPGDLVRFRVTSKGIMIERLVVAGEPDPFAAFEEWTSEADRRGYADL
ncbi:MAG: AbrB/MazE/SpoVT family DNA-binding domain-containing protein [Alphaproteobacteria bacterium]|nr:AbrB/MazE/SpoVT family DNA-binding domain-containing protein [Alphaproteobacteria bacterium]